MINVSKLLESKRVEVTFAEIKIDKDFVKRFRLENHLTSNTQGNGLGLYITKNLVEAMNGTISAYSIPNLSTEFWVEFPFYDQEEALKCFQQS